MELLVAFFAGSLSILITWIFLAIIFIGLGLNVQRLFGLRAIDTDRCLMSFWARFSFVILFLQTFGTYIAAGKYYCVET